MMHNVGSEPTSLWLCVRCYTLELQVHMQYEWANNIYEMLWRRVGRVVKASHSWPVAMGSTPVQARSTWYESRYCKKYLKYIPPLPTQVCTRTFSYLVDKYQLDYMLIRRKWRNSVKNALCCNNFASIGSDHRIFSARVSLSLRSNQKGTMRKWNTTRKCLSKTMNCRRDTR